MFGEGIRRLLESVIEQLKTFKSPRPEKTKDEKEKEAEKWEKITFSLIATTVNYHSFCLPVGSCDVNLNSLRERSYTDTDQLDTRERKPQRSYTC